MTLREFSRVQYQTYVDFFTEIPGIQEKEIDSQLNESYTFKRFIEGDCNQLARSAAWAIAQEPGGITGESMPAQEWEERL